MTSVRRASASQSTEETVKPLRHILRKPESQRSDVDIKKLADFFKNIKFFAQLDPQVRFDTYQQFKHNPQASGQCGLMVMTFASHAKGSQFDPGH